MYYCQACLFVCLSPVCLSPLSAFLSVKLIIHKGNTGQLFNSRVLGVLSVITLTMTQVSVCQSQLSYPKII